MLYFLHGLTTSTSAVGEPGKLDESGSGPLLELELSSKGAKNVFSWSGKEGTVEVGLLLLSL